MPHDAEVGMPGIHIRRGRVRCTHFPLVIMTSNGEREFPPPFLRRCLQLEMQLPDREKLARIVRAHLDMGPEHEDRMSELIDAFLDRRDNRRAELPADQLLNAVYLALNNIDPEHSYAEKDALIETLWRSLTA